VVRDSPAVLFQRLGGCGIAAEREAVPARWLLDDIAWARGGEFWAAGGFGSSGFHGLLAICRAVEVEAVICWGGGSGVLGFFVLGGWLNRLGADGQKGLRLGSKMAQARPWPKTTKPKARPS